MLIIFEVFAREQFRQKNDLPSVLREVLDNMRDRFEHRDIVALWSDSFGQPSGGHCANNRRGFGNLGLQKLDQFSGRSAAPCVKLRVALAMVRQSSDTRTDPLTNIPRKMQHQIANRIFVFGTSRPDLFRRKPRKAILDPAMQLFERVGGECDEDLFCGHNTSSDQFSRIDFTFPVN